MCFKKETLIFLFLVLLGFPELAEAGTEKKEGNLEFDIQLGYGRESNVFLSENNAKSDTFIQFESTLSHLFEPNSQSILFTIFSVSHSQFIEYEQANRSFLALSSYYRYVKGRGLSVGFVNTLSYTDLRLSDTEGEALPIDQFKAINDRLRLYGLYNISTGFRVGLGLFYQVFDVEESASEGSLDYQTRGLDLSSRFIANPQKSLKLKYVLSWLRYAERKALNRMSGTDNTNNPNLVLRRQELSARLKLKRSESVLFKIRLKYRRNSDIFENHLSYHQIEFKSGFERTNGVWADLTFGLTYRNRRYTDRENDSDTLLEENFVIVDLKLTRNVWAWLWVSFRQEGTWKSSNATSDDFMNQQSLLSFDGRW